MCMCTTLELVHNFQSGTRTEAEKQATYYRIFFLNHVEHVHYATTSNVRLNRRGQLEDHRKTSQEQRDSEFYLEATSFGRKCRRPYPD